MSTTVRKVFAYVLAVVMTLTMALGAIGSAWADAPADPNPTKGSITISNPAAGETYSVYRVFDLTVNTETGAHAYTISEKWGAKDFATSETFAKYFVLNNGYVTIKDATTTDAAALAQDLHKFAVDNEIANDGQQKATGETMVFSDMPLGYYLVDTTLGTLCSLDTANPNALIQAKNSKPDFTVNAKQVKENSTSQWGTENDANIGDTVDFQVTINAKPGAENLVLHDTMAPAFEFNGSVTVTKDGIEVPADGNYALVTEGLGDNCTFEVQFTPAFCAGITDKSGETIVISYSAQLKSNATITGEGNANVAKLSYGANNTMSDRSTTVTKTWPLPVEKVATGSTTHLAGATFVLSTTNSEDDALHFTAGDNGVYTLDSDGAVSSITTTETGIFTLQGLDSGKYYLIETAGPAGYNKLANPIEVTVSNTGNISYNDVQTSNKVIVENSTGTELPSTGGMGTTIFYIVGGVLVLGAVVLAVTKRKLASQR